MTKVLITGGTGMIGSGISKQLTQAGHQVVHLSRTTSADDEYSTFAWDIGKGVIDEKAFEGVEFIIHLAGASINQRWTEKNKKIIIDSRVKSANLLLETVQRLKTPLKAFISMSAIGYYGGDTGDKLLTESSNPGKDFLAETVTKWENGADQFQAICPVTKFRTGVVLSSEGGALPQIAMPVRYGVGAPIGSGKQWMSWVHIDDVVNAFCKAVEGRLSGTFNLVAPQPVTNAQFTRAIAKALQRPLILPNVPSFVLRLALGEMATIVIGGNNVSSDFLETTGFKFKYTELVRALKDLLV